MLVSALTATSISRSHGASLYRSRSISKKSKRASLLLELEEDVLEELLLELKEEPEERLFLEEDKLETELNDEDENNPRSDISEEDILDIEELDELWELNELLETLWANALKGIATASKADKGNVRVFIQPL